jgi:hypothetical protein
LSTCFHISEKHHEINDENHLLPGGGLGRGHDFNGDSLCPNAKRRPIDLGHTAIRGGTLNRDLHAANWFELGVDDDKRDNVRSQHHQQCRRRRRCLKAAVSSSGGCVANQ